MHVKQCGVVERCGAVLMHRLGAPRGSRGDTCPVPVPSCAAQLRAAPQCPSSGDGPGVGARAGRAPVVWPTSTGPGEVLPEPARGSLLRLTALDKFSSLLMSKSSFNRLLFRAGCARTSSFSMHCV